MQRSIVNPIYTGIAWLPFLAIIAFCVLVLAIGAMRLEAMKGATNYFHTRTAAQQSAEQQYNTAPTGSGDSEMLGVG